MPPGIFFVRILEIRPPLSTCTGMVTPSLCEGAKEDWKTLLGSRLHNTVTSNPIDALFYSHH